MTILWDHTTPASKTKGSTADSAKKVAGPALDSGIDLLSSKELSKGAPPD